MEITHQIDLDRYYPKEIIALHLRGIITINEIILSKRYCTAFGPELSDYVHNYLQSQAKLDFESLGKTKTL